jgi:hypothetical protein
MKLEKKMSKKKKDVDPHQLFKSVIRIIGLKAQ